CAVAAGRRDHLAVGTEGDGVNLPLVPQECFHLSTCGDVEDLDPWFPGVCNLPTGDGEKRAIRAEGDAAPAETLFRSYERTHVAARLHVPGLDAAVAAGHGQLFAVGSEGQKERLILMQTEGAQFTSTGGIPEHSHTRAPFPSRRGNYLAVGAEGKTVERLSLR